MSLTQRYLMYISYIGTGFRGSQIQKSRLPRNVTDTVQGTLENALKDIFSTQTQLINTGICSRTDSGVHAIRSGVHVDLPPFKGKFLAPHAIQDYLNRKFLKQNLNLRISEALQVPDVFNARFSAVEKIYVYRFATLKKRDINKRYPTPISEIQRTLFMSNDGFDLQKTSKAAELFVGEKDFTTFAGKFSKNTRSTICRISSFTIERSQAFMPNLDPATENYEFYHLKCIGNRFLYKMVRRMVGALLSVGLSKINLNDIQYMLEYPKPSSWNTRIFVVPGYALYLSNVTFKPEHLVLTSEELQKKNKLLEPTEVSMNKSNRPFSGLKNFYDKTSI